MKDISEKLFSKAQNKINLAEQNLMKPKEDIVSFSVCIHSRTAIQFLLESYLIKNNVPIKEKESIALLLERCIIYNSKFKAIDFTKIDCRHNTTNHGYCNSIDKVSNCLLVAKQIEELLVN